MGGAFVAVADSVRAAYTNPAGLALVPLSEVALSSGHPWLGGSTGIPHVRVAGYAARTDEQSVALGGTTGPGSLESSVSEAGLAVGAEPFRRVMVGATMAWSRLRLEGGRQAAEAGVPPATVAAEDGRLRLTAGLLLTLMGGESRALPSLRLGVAYQPGFDWAARIEGGTAGADGAAVDVRRPTVVSAGLAMRVSDRWGFSAQGDLIRYREVTETLRRNVGDGSDFRLPDAVEPRVGAEFSAPLWCGCGVIKIRGGLYYRSPGTLRYEGSDPVLAAAFPTRSWRTVAALGGSFFTEHFDNALRLDLDARDLFDGPDLSFGVAWRF
jgi:hypothetical protein